VIEALVLCLLGARSASCSAPRLSFCADAGLDHAGDLSAVVVAFVFSAAVGLVFGVWPARQPRRSTSSRRFATSRREDRRVRSFNASGRCGFFREIDAAGVGQASGKEDEVGIDLGQPFEGLGAARPVCTS
jgi:hypothetical protein